MPRPGDMIAAIASRSYENSEGQQMRDHLREQQEERAPRAKLLESEEGKRFVESIRAVHGRLTKLLANAPAGAIATPLKKQLAEIAADLNV